MDASSPTPPEHAAKPDALEQRLSTCEAGLHALETEVTGQEHRLVQVVRNAYWALGEKSGWSRQRRLEAGAALIRYFLTGRAILVFSVGLGGLLALHASFMLADQNRKLDLQNYLAIVNSELAEAQRNSQFVQLIAPLVQEIQSGRRNAAQSERNRAGQEIRSLDPALAVRIAALTKTFQPYRWSQRSVDADQVLRNEGEGLLYTALTAARRGYEEAFGRDRIGDELAKQKLPGLTVHRLSPERGLLLINLHALQVDFTQLARWNADFQSAYAPSANLEGIDLGPMEGPSTDRALDLSFAELSGASLNRSYLPAVGFVTANLSVASLNGVRAPGANFMGANLDGASFVGADLSDTKFEMAYIGDTDFRLANLSGADLRKVRGATDAKLQQACIDPQTTQLPPEFALSKYSVPQECCNMWNGQHDRFRRTAEGVCASSRR